MAAILVAKDLADAVPTGHWPKSSVHATRSVRGRAARARRIASRRAGRSADRSRPCRLRREQQARVGDRAAHRPDHRDRRPAERRAAPPARVPATGGSRRRRISRPGCAANRRCPSPCTRAACRSASATAEPPDEPPALSVGIERIAGRAPHGIAGVGAGTELRHVGLADDDGAGRAHARDHGGVALRHEVAIERRAVGRQQPPGLVQVLDAGRQAVQQARAHRRARPPLPPPWLPARARS